MAYKPPTPKTAPSRIPKTATKPGDQPEINDGARDKARVDFQADKFINAIRTKGYPVIWRKAILCPCRTEETDQPRPDCEQCDGSGFFYIEPVQIHALMTNLEKKKDIYRNLGEWLTGSSMATTEPQNRMGYRDSLEMVHSVMTFNEWIEKGNRRGVRSKLPAGKDVARYRIVNPLHLYWMEDNQLRLLEQGAQYRIDDNGWIEWVGTGRSIPDGTIISVNYEFHPVWIVMTHPHAVRDTLVRIKNPEQTVTPLPVQAAVKLDYLFSDVVMPVTGILE